jgi:hypothetical protein
MEDSWRESLVKGGRCWRLKEFGRESLAKGERPWSGVKSPVIWRGIFFTGRDIDKMPI